MKKTFFNTLLLTFIFTSLAVIANASTYFTVNMSGTQMVPPTLSTATAFLAFEIDDFGILRGRLQGTGIPSSGITVTVQCPLESFDVPMPTTFFFIGGGSGTLTTALKNDSCFFRINTTAFPSGEIGGYAKVTNPFLATLNQGQFIGSQSFTNPGISGKAAVVLNNTQTKACLITVFSGMNPIRDIRIFSGKPGENGTLVNSISLADVFDFNPGDGYSVFDISPTNVAKLKAGQIYIEIANMSILNTLRGQFHRRRSVAVDYDGDGKTDHVVARKNTAGNIVNWYARRSSDGSFSVFNTPNASHFDNFLMAPGDYDGDGKDDVAYWISGTFYILQSSNSVLRTETFGVAGDDPTIVDDFDGDGKTDLAVYRGGASTGMQSFFYYKPSSNNPGGNIVFTPFGTSGDFPSSGDYDGDAKADFVIQRPTSTGRSEVWILKSSGGNLAYAFGFNSDLMTPGDYDGDGKTDVCLTRGTISNKEWYILRSLNTTYYAFPFGSGDAAITQGDYDGDGKTDPSVAQTTGTQNYFWTLRSSDGSVSPIQWGSDGDLIVNGFNIH